MRFRTSIPPVLLLACILLNASSPAPAAPLFPNPVYTVGPNPYGLGLVDFNRDGIQDMVVANYGPGYDGLPGDLSLRFGRGDGTFGDEIRLPTAERPANVLAADINRDGVGDLIIQYWPSGRVVRMRGLGDGTFGPETQIAVDVFTLQLADFNADGIPDLLSEAGLANAGFQAFLGHADFTFSPGPVTGPPVTFIPVTGDFNGDGLGDVAALRYVSSTDPKPILVYLGNGDGTFSAAPSFMADDEVLRLTTADVDGDGRDDLGVQTYHPHGATSTVTG